MRNLIKLPQLFILCLVICFLSSCNTTNGWEQRNPEPLEKYKGSIIYDVGNGYEFIIRIKDDFKEVQVYRLDYERYAIGDTIK